MTLALAALLGVAAGGLTTLAGQGGGLFLLLAVSAFLGPHAALAITSPALLFGNAHRAFLFRRWIDRAIAIRIIAGALPGAFFGGLVAGVLPPSALHVVLIGVTGLAIAKHLGWIRFVVPRAALGPSGFVIGGLTGTVGGAGVLQAPLLLAVGLTGSTFVGIISIVAVATHFGRVVAYGSFGLFRTDLLVPTLVVTLAIFAGNALAERVRKRLSDRTTVRLEYGTLVVCVALAAFGLG